MRFVPSSNLQSPELQLDSFINQTEVQSQLCLLLCESVYIPSDILINRAEIQEKSLTQCHVNINVSNHKIALSLYVHVCVLLMPLCAQKSCRLSQQINPAQSEHYFTGTCNEECVFSAALFHDFI